MMINNHEASQLPRITSQERQVLRDLALRVAEIAALPVMPERRALWTRHNSLQPCRPLVLIFPEGAWRELLPPDVIMCESDEARRLEYDLRIRIYTFENFHCDNVITDDWEVPPVITSTGWGLEPERIPSSNKLGAWTFAPVVHEPEDLAKLRYPEISVDEQATADKLAQAQDIFSDILCVKRVGIKRISFHLMQQWTSLRGLEEVMTDMYLEPEMLHDAMAFLEEGNRRLVQQYESLNLLELNNDNTYHNSGGNGYTTDLPLADFDPAHVRPADMWASAEAQEMAGVSPKQHAEFVLPYEKRLLAPFGLTGYGCCEDLTHKLDDVLTIPNIRRISISPWADVKSCAEQLGGRAIFSWKPLPVHLVGNFDTDAIRQYIRHTLDVTDGCHVEMILKDTHTCESKPERFEAWSRIAMEEIGTLSRVPDSKT